jgi:hypothetical protein
MLAVSKDEIIYRIEQIDAILTTLHDLRRRELEMLEMIEMNESSSGCESELA